MQQMVIKGLMEKINREEPTFEQRLLMIKTLSDALGAQGRLVDSAAKHLLVAAEAESKETSAEETPARTTEELLRELS